MAWLWVSAALVAIGAALYLRSRSHAAHAHGSGEFIPALGYHALTGLYDWVVYLTCREETFKHALVLQTRHALTAAAAARQSAVVPRVVDVGCGSGTLLLRLHAQSVTEVRAAAAAGAGAVAVVPELHGVDADSAMLAMATRKAEAINAKPGAEETLQLHLHCGMAQNLPQASDSVDACISSLFFHHLPYAAKVEVLRDAYRVLRPGGTLQIADWGRAANPISRVLFALTIQLLDGFATTRDNVDGLMPQAMRDAGFADARQVTSFETLCGTMALFTATKPASD